MEYAGENASPDLVRLHHSPINIAQLGEKCHLQFPEN
jgi:hypothetical protein